ncbi:MAG: hypothetical protein KAT12_09130 [Gammaproteobacteria bacterium]|nr:hypothetical protein [Gammaproteobacteria bacterium]
MRYLLIAVYLLFANAVQATSGWTDYGHVIELVPTIHHRFKVNLEVKGNKSGCKEKQWFYQDYDISGAREMYLALLEAVSSNRSVRVYVTGRCNINEYAEISELGIRSD